MPALTQSSYEVLLDFTNDTHDCATIQLLRDYGRNTSAIVLLHPGESITLVLDAGSVYKYALKSHSKVANVRGTSYTCISSSTVSDMLSEIVAREVGEIYDVRYRNCLGEDHGRRSVRPPSYRLTASLSSEYGGTIASMFGMTRDVVAIVEAVASIP